MVDEYRDQLSRRLALVAFLCFAISLTWRLFPFQLVGLLVVLLFVRGRPALFVGVLAGLVGAGLAPFQPALDFERKPFRELVTVVSAPYPAREATWVRVAASGRVFDLRLRPEDSLNPGSTAWVGGQQLPLPESRLGYHGAVAEIHPIGRIEIVSPGLSLFGLGIGLRRSFEGFVSASLPLPTARLVESLCFGGSSGLDEPVLTKSGALPIFVSSGLHILVFGSLLMSVFRFIPVRREFKLFALFLFLLVFVVASGFRPSMIRGALMALLMHSAYLFGRGYDPLNALGVAGTANFLIDPWSVYDPGVWIGAAVVLGMSLYGRPRWPLAPLARPLWLNAVVNLFSAPLLALCFGQIPVLSVLTGLISLPFLEWTMAWTLAAWMISSVSPAFGSFLLSAIVGPSVEGLVSFLRAVSGLPFSSVSFGPFSGYWLIPLFLGLVLFWRFERVPPD